MKLGNRYSQHSFAQIPSVNIARSQFNRSFAIKDTFNFDELVPFFVDEVLPGDTINLNFKMFARLATQIKPVMDNMYLDFFFFFVPNRLVWDNWERFNGAQDDPGDSTDYLVPKIQAPFEGFAVGSIYDHFGIPTGVGNIEISALPLRAYNLIRDEWFRDQNLQERLPRHRGDGPDPDDDYKLVKRAKLHDYFTSCLPWPQKGPSIGLPLGGEAPVYGSGPSLVVGPTGNGEPLFASSNAPDFNLKQLGSPFEDPREANIRTTNIGTGVTAGNLRWADPKLGASIDGLYADLSESTAATINQIRQAFMMQSLLELDARGGTRYVEILRAHFNVVSPDFRLQRPEFLSAGRVMLNQHPVAQTSESGTTPLADLAAFSTAAETGNRIGFSKSFVEHGYVIGLVQARGEVTYQQGLNRMWSRSTRWDFFWPKLQELGEQAVLNKEIYAQGTPDDEEVFGYQERYAEYRYRPSEIRGQFRSTFDESLDVWHLAEEFGNLPTLSSEFIESNTPIERALVVSEDYPHLLLDGWFDYKHARPMLTYGVPATLGRF